MSRQGGLKAILVRVQVALGRLSTGGVRKSAGPVGTPSLEPTYGPFVDRSSADAAKAGLTRQHLAFLNDHRGFLSVEQTDDGRFWVVRHLAQQRLRDDALRVWNSIPPVP